MEIDVLKQAVEELNALSEEEIYLLWLKYHNQTMDFRGCVVRENDLVRFKEWLFSSPFLYYKKQDLFTCIKRRLNISELIVLDQGEVCSFKVPENFDRQYLISSSELSKYLLIKNTKAKQIIMPSLIEVPLYEFDDYIDNTTWNCETIDIALECIENYVLTPLRHSHDCRCDINDIRLYIRPTIPSYLLIGVLAECRETGSKMWY